MSVIDTMAKKLVDLPKYENAVANVNSDPFYETAPKSLDKKTLDKAREHVQNYVAATAKATEMSLANADDVSEILGDANSLVTTWGMGEGQTVSHVANKTDEGWKAYTEVNTELDSIEVLTDIQKNIAKLL